MIVDVKWDGDEAYLVFPDGTLPKEWEVGDLIEWIDNKDGTWTMKKKERNFVREVVEFNRLAGGTGEFDSRKVALYVGLQLEEMAEKIESIPSPRNELGKLRTALEYHATLFKSGKFDALVEQMTHEQRVEALDADIDLAVVALGGACALGAEVELAANEVMSSNMSKCTEDEQGNRYMAKDENGKVIKGKNFFKPNLKNYVK